MHYNKWYYTNNDVSPVSIHIVGGEWWLNALYYTNAFSVTHHPLSNMRLRHTTYDRYAQICYRTPSLENTQTQFCTSPSSQEQSLPALSQWNSWWNNLTPDPWPFSNSSLPVLSAGKRHNNKRGALTSLRVDVVLTTLGRLPHDAIHRHAGVGPAPHVVRCLHVGEAQAVWNMTRHISFAFMASDWDSGISRWSMEAHRSSFKQPCLHLITCLFGTMEEASASFLSLAPLYGITSPSSPERNYSLSFWTLSNPTSKQCLSQNNRPVMFSPHT